MLLFGLCVLLSASLSFFGGVIHGIGRPARFRLIGFAMLLAACALGVKSLEILPLTFRSSRNSTRHIPRPFMVP